MVRRRDCSLVHTLCPVEELAVRRSPGKHLRQACAQGVVQDARTTLIEHYVWSSPSRFDIWVKRTPWRLQDHELQMPRLSGERRCTRAAPLQNKVRVVVRGRYRGERSARQQRVFKERDRGPSRRGEPLRVPRRSAASCCSAENSCSSSQRAPSQTPRLHAQARIRSIVRDSGMYRLWMRLLFVSRHFIVTRAAGPKSLYACSADTKASISASQAKRAHLIRRLSRYLKSRMIAAASLKRNGLPALHVAARSGDAELVRRILASGADADERTEARPQHQATRLSCPLSPQFSLPCPARLLTLSLRAARRVSQTGMNALFEAAPHCVPILVAAGAKLDAVDSVRGNFLLDPPSPPLTRGSVLLL